MRMKTFLWINVWKGYLIGWEKSFEHLFPWQLNALVPITQPGSTLWAENDLISYSLRIEALEQHLFLTGLGAISRALTAREVCLRKSGLRQWGIGARRGRREAVSLCGHQHMKREARDIKTVNKRQTHLTLKVSKPRVISASSSRNPFWSWRSSFWRVAVCVDFVRVEVQAHLWG